MAFMTYKTKVHEKRNKSKKKTKHIFSYKSTTLGCVLDEILNIFRMYDTI